MYQRPQVASAISLLINDVQGLLLTRYAYKDLIQRWQSKQIEQTELNRLITVTTLESLEREMISCLYRLDAEDHFSFHSVKKIWKSLGLTGDENEEIAVAITKFRKQLSAVKTRRNSYIAHMTKQFDGVLPDVLDCTGLVDSAVATLSVILGEQFVFTMRFEDTKTDVTFTTLA